MGAVWSAIPARFLIGVDLENLETLMMLLTNLLLRSGSVHTCVPDGTLIDACRVADLVGTPTTNMEAISYHSPQLLPNLPSIREAISDHLVQLAGVGPRIKEEQWWIGNARAVRALSAVRGKSSACRFATTQTNRLEPTRRHLWV